MTQQIIYLSLLYLTGMLFNYLFKGKIDRPLFYVSAFLSGQMIWVLIGLFYLCTGIPYTITTMALGLTTLVSVIVIYIAGKNYISRRDIIEMSAAFLFFMVLATAISHINLSILSPDSFIQLNAGRNIALNEGIGVGSREELASWGVFLLLIQSASVFLGIDYLHAAMPITWVSFFITFFWLLRKMVSSIRGNSLFVDLLVALAVICMATSYFISFQSFYIHNNFLSAAYLFLSAATMWLGFTEKKREWFMLSMFFITAFSLLRTESLLFAIIFLVIMFSNAELQHREKMKLILPYAAIMLVWESRLFFIVGEGSDIMTPGKISVLIGCLVMFTLLVCLSFSGKIQKLLGALPLIMLYTFAVIILIASILKPANTSLSLHAVVHNMFTTGRWGALWLIIIPSFIFSLFLRRIPHERIFIFSILSFFMLVIAFSFSRIPYRIGWGDSANRIITHIVPIMVSYVVLKYPGNRFVPAASSAKMRPASGVINVFTILSGIILLITLISYIQSMPLDLIKTAKVMESPEWCPPDNEGAHDLNTALRFVKGGQYAAAVNSGPATIVLKMENEIRASTIEMTDYSPDIGLLDYAWHISSDGQQWRMIFDTRNPGSLNRRSVSNVTSRYYIGDKGPFRFLRLTFREGKGQNRLLLRKIAVYNKNLGDDLINLFKKYS